MMPTSEQRMAAAAAYGSPLLGFWLVGALLVYGHYRTTSYFAAHHAIRAAVIQVVAAATFALSFVFYMVTLVVFSVIASSQRPPSSLVPMLATLPLLLLAVGPVCGLVVSVLGGLRALRGEVGTDSWLDRRIHAHLTRTARP